MSLGIVILFIVILGYASNRLNWRFLDHTATRFLYYIGALVHESSHAILCIATGAKIAEFKPFSSQPRVVHGRPKLPIIGNLLISCAPILGGLLFLFLVNHFLLGDHFAVPSFDGGWKNALYGSLGFLGQLRPWQWQSSVMVLVLLNSGAMLGPSWQDIKNVWPAVIILFFVQWPFLAGIGLAAAALIAANIVVQILLVLIIKLGALIRR